MFSHGKNYKQIRRKLQELILTRDKVIQCME